MRENNYIETKDNNEEKNKQKTYCECDNCDYCNALNF